MAIENWKDTDWYLTDPNNDVNISQYHININTMKRDVIGYFNKSYGDVHFGDFCHDIHVYFTAADVRAGAGFWALSNYSNRTYADMETFGEGMISILYRSAAGDYSIQLYDFSVPNGDSYTCAVATNYYVRIERTGTTLTEKIYSDATRTVLLDTLSVTCETIEKRYLYSVISFDFPNYPNQSITFDIYNLSLTCGEAVDFKYQNKNSQSEIYRNKPSQEEVYHKKSVSQEEIYRSDTSQE